MIIYNEKYFSHSMSTLEMIIFQLHKNNTTNVLDYLFTSRNYGEQVN